MRILMMNLNANAARGEIWEVQFNPSEGDEIRKIRLAVVMDVKDAGRMRLHIVVPITGWQTVFGRYFWIVNIQPDVNNGLRKESAADAFQIKSVSTRRFQQKTGLVTAEQLAQITTAAAYCIGYRL